MSDMAHALRRSCSQKYLIGGYANMRALVDAQKAQMDSSLNAPGRSYNSAKMLRSVIPSFWTIRCQIVALRILISFKHLKYAELRLY